MLIVITKSQPIKSFVACDWLRVE